MKTSRLKQGLVVILPLLLLLLALYLLFGQSWQSIWQQLQQIKGNWFALALALSGLYYVMDARSFQLVVRRLLPAFSWREALDLVAMGLFMNVTTFGAGIKPAQALYLRDRNADVGESLGVLMLPYVFHKMTIVLYGIFYFVLYHGFVSSHFSELVRYIYLGYALSVLICIFLVLIFVSARFHRECFELLEKIPAGARYHQMIAKAQVSTHGMRQQIKSALTNERLCLRMFGINMAKFFCWYSVAGAAFRAIGLSALPVSYGQCLAMAAMVQLLIGVIPMTGGLVSSEVVFVLLFSVIAGQVAAGSAMLVFRMATYYLPVLISCFYTLALYWSRRRARNKASV